MSQEIRTNVSVVVNNAGYSDTFSQVVAINQSAQGANAGVLAVATSGTDLPVGSISTNGCLALFNCDSANYVQYGIASHLVAQINAGEWAFLRVIPGATVHFVANTATVNVQFLLLNN